MPKHKVFVYGTLRPSKEATHVLLDFDMFAYSGGKFSFPYIVEHDWEDDRYEMGMRFVLGNIVEVDGAELAQLDKYEGVARGLYVRSKVDVYEFKKMGKGKPVRGEKERGVWVYVAGPALISPAVPSGDWFNR